MVLELPRLAPKSLVIGCQHTAFATGGHDLVLAEREGRNITQRPDRPSFVGCPMTLCTIFNDLEIILTGQIKNRVHVARPASQMNTDNCFGTGSYASSDSISCNVLADRIHICQHRDSASHDDATGRGDECTTGCDDLIPGTNAEHKQGKLQGNSAISQSNSVINPAVGSKFLLKIPPFCPGPVVYFSGP